MEHARNDLLPRFQDSFLHIPYKQRWDCLKPLLITLYTGDYGTGGRRKATLDQIVEFMKFHYSFHAAPSEYRTHFRQWKVKNRTESEIKNSIPSVLGRRKRSGISTTQVHIKHGDRTEPLDPKKLKRHLKDSKASWKFEVMSPGLLSSFNMPYTALRASLPRNPEHSSPYGSLPPTPVYLSIQSPEALTPGREQALPSPNMQLVNRYNRERHTMLFLQGEDKLKDLLISLDRDERRILVDYFHDFYLHAFTKTKHWGASPRMAHPSHTSMSTPSSVVNNAWTPTAFLDFSANDSSPDHGSRDKVPDAPTQLCRWLIHVDEVPYDSVMTDSVMTEDSDPVTFTASLQNSLVSNDFTETLPSDLPIAREILVHALEIDKTALQLDAWKMAIITGNCDLLEQLYIENGEEPPERSAEVYPFHLAAAYLNGGQTCCKVFGTLKSVMGPSFLFHNYIDNTGNTVLDGLFVSILRSHTRLAPEHVSSEFQPPHRYPGEEQDTCGRWDSESPAVRQMLKQGHPRIPSAWKHPFCHSAVQAVCHSIIEIFAPESSPVINTESGLFVRHCTNCGKKLVLRPLHTVVVMAFYLAHLGLPGETLFGSLAMMTCLLAMGANALIRADISVEDILRVADPGKCSHTQMTALELMQAVPSNVVGQWMEDCKTGWNCLHELLVRAGNIETQDDKTKRLFRVPTVIETDHGCVLDDEDSDYGHFGNFPCLPHALGLCWAGIQTEILTYRRIEEGDPWISNNFSMARLRDWLAGQVPGFSIPLVEQGMMKPFSHCGWFYEARNPLLPVAEQVSVEHFMNLDIYSRSTFAFQANEEGTRVWY